MRHTNKFLIKTLLLFFTASLLSFSSCSKSKKELEEIQQADPVIAFYKVNKQNADVIKNSLENYCAQNSINVTFEVLDDSDSDKLKKQIENKKISLVITNAGKSQREITNLSDENAGISDNIFKEVLNSMSQSVIYNKKHNAIAIPFLFDHLELDVDTNALRSGKTENIEVLADLEKFATEQKNSDLNDIEYPIIFAGNDSIDFFDLLGALCEAIDGPEFYQQALEIINSFDSKLPENTAKKLLTDAKAPMLNTAKTLKRYFKNGLIYSGCFGFTERDLQGFANNRLVSAIFMPLSWHRNFPANDIKRFATTYIPAETTTPNRSFTANIFYAIPVTQNNKVNSLVAQLLDQELQETLCFSTGLAPVMRNCRTPDIQSDDARYWIAATNKPVPGLGHDAEITKEQLDLLKEAVKGVLLYY